MRSGAEMLLTVIAPLRSVAAETYRRASGFERMMITLGAIVDPATALW